MCVYFCLHEKSFTTLFVSNGFSLYILTNNLAGRSLQIFSEYFTWDENRSSEAAMGGGARNAPLCPLKRLVKNVCVQRIGASAAKTH